MQKKFKGAHAGMCNVRWPAEDPFSPLLMFSVFPFCQIVQLSFSCVTPLWCSLWDFLFYFVRWMYRNWFQNTFGFICILKLVEKIMLVLMCLFLLLFIFKTKLLKFNKPSLVLVKNDLQTGALWSILFWLASRYTRYVIVSSGFLLPHSH